MAWVHTEERVVTLLSSVTYTLTCCAWDTRLTGLTTSDRETTVVKKYNNTDEKLSESYINVKLPRIAWWKLIESKSMIQHPQHVVRVSYESTPYVETATVNFKSDMIYWRQQDFSGLCKTWLPFHMKSETLCKSFRLYRHIPRQKFVSLVIL
jgi:hypothetical protein